VSFVAAMEMDIDMDIDINLDVEDRMVDENVKTVDSSVTTAQLTASSLMNKTTTARCKSHPK
jgi:hypothetical protein